MRSFRSTPAPCLRQVFGVLFFLLSMAQARSQCPVTINAFPYNEGFEAAPAWTSGGTASGWAWGAPTGPTINGAGGGTNCWVVGGLTGAGYNDGEQSFLAGPCFNFTTLPNPWISFKIFWECERDYDGMALQYSLNAGTTWINVGAFGSQVNCLNANWYNTQFISNLDLATIQQGWSGRIGPTVGACAGGSGSNGWVTASQCLGNLAGQPSVKFRFIFGAGTACNGYDGIAIDDIFIGSAPPNQAGFNFICDGNSVAFESTSALCPTGFAWDFGDPASGADNTSTVANPTHTFPGPGTYNVTLTVTGPCNASSTLTVPVSVLGLEFITEDPSCAGSDGSIIAIVSGTSVPLDVVWAPGGETTVVLTGVGPGTYTITASAANACSIQGSVDLLTGGVSLTAEGNFTDITCNGATDGTASITVVGGTPDYTYAWAPQGGTGAEATGLGPGTYTCIVTDAVGCTAEVEGTITEPDVLVLTVGPDADICAGESLTLEAEVNGGTPGYTVVYLPEGPDVSPSVTTIYTIVVTDANGCASDTALTTITVSGPAAPVLSVDDAEGCSPHCVVLTATGADDLDYSWDLGDGNTADGPSASHCYLDPGTFPVSLTVTDGSGCERTEWLNFPISAQAPPEVGIVVAPSVTTIERPTVLFMAATEDGELWYWTFGEGEDAWAEGPVATYTFPEVDCYEVVLRVSSNLGCTDSTAIVYCVEDPFALYGPNAFTPNGDGVNDRFYVVTTVARPKDFELLIFDRWGRVAFTGNAPDQGWDGTIGGAQASSGTYVWKVRLRDTERNDIQERIGHVILVR